jgi:two-component system chemotaxis response regulator CheY
MEKFAPVKRSEDGQPVRYLIVDDSVFARKNLARMVETFGGQVAAKQATEFPRSASTTGSRPTSFSWISPCRRWKASRPRKKSSASIPNARIVMVSSVGYQENIVAALQRGARHFVQKPVKPEVLYEVIKYVMGDDGAVASRGSRSLVNADGSDSAVHQLGRRRAGARPRFADFHRELEHGRGGLPAEGASPPRCTLPATSKDELSSI